MGVTLDAWRAAIGLFHHGRKPSSFKKYFMPKMMFHSNDYFHTYSIREWARCLLKGRHCRMSTKLCMNYVALTLIIQLALLCSGIHPNPGPINNTEYSDISICHVNIRSLKSRDNYGFLHKMLHIKAELGNRYDIITVSETWLTPNDKSSSYGIQNYQSPFRRDREVINGTLGYGGVLAWVCNNIACKRRMDLELPNIEAMWLEVRSKNNKMLLCVAYRQPSKDNFWELLQTNINMVTQMPGTKILLTGDLNADPLTPEGRRLSEFAYANGLTVHINQPT